MRRLERGDSPDAVKRDLAEKRSDKPNPKILRRAYRGQSPAKSRSDARARPLLALYFVRPINCLANFVRVKPPYDVQ